MDLAPPNQALDRFRDQPNQLGRARMFGAKSIGLDDPGMLAFRRLLDGLTGEDDRRRSCTARGLVGS